MSSIKQYAIYMWGKMHHLCIVHPYCTIRHLWPVWYYISNAEARRAYLRHLPQLSDVQKRIIADFKRDGVAITHLDELFPGTHLLPDLQRYTRELAQHAEVKSGKQFLRYLWDAVPVFDFNNPFLKIALDPVVVDIMNNYLGVWGKFYFFTLNITDPIVPGAKPQQSQRWHRDSGDKYIPKIFIYVNDVDEGTGPFTCVKGTQYGGKWRSLFRQRPPHGSRAPSGKVDEIVPAGDIKACTGRAGTIIFFDTSGLHKGGYATQKERIMFTGVFASAASYKDNKRREIRHPNDFEKQLAAANLPAAVRFAVVRPTPSLPMRIVNRLGNPWIEKDY